LQHALCHNVGCNVAQPRDCAGDERSAAAIDNDAQLSLVVDYVTVFGAEEDTYLVRKGASTRVLTRTAGASIVLFAATSDDRAIRYSLGSQSAGGAMALEWDFPLAVRSSARIDP
jgi:hypothetical protein